MPLHHDRDGYTFGDDTHTMTKDPPTDPPVGRGSFVIIGVEHQMQRRFGRQNLAGVLAGRDPLDFTGCR